MNSPKKSAELPVTQKMLEDTREELKHDIASLRLEMKSSFKKMDSNFEKMLSIVKRNQVLMEEQRAQNLYVLDGYQSLYDRQERMDIDFKNLKRDSFNIGKKK